MPSFLLDSNPIALSPLSFVLTLLFAHQPRPKHHILIAIMIASMVFPRIYRKRRQLQYLRNEL